MIKQELLKYLQKYKSITADECRVEIGTTECRKYISVLRLNYNIADTWEYGYNRYGHNVKWKRYFYLGEKNKIM